MNWRKYLTVLLVIMGLMLVACGGNAAPANNNMAEEPAATVEEPTAEPVEEEPTAEPTEEEEMEEPAEEEEMDEEAEEESMEGEAEMASEEELDQAFQNFLADMEAYNTIGIEEVNTMLVEDPESLFLLDVRQPSELEENGWIEGTVNIPLREVADQVEYLPGFDTTIVSYCGSGWRCTIALTALEAMGWEDVLGLKGGSFGGWVEAGYPIVEGEIPEPEALNAADPDPAIQAAMQEMLHNVPEGYGVIRPDALNAELAENPDLILIDVRREEEVEEKGYIDAPNVIFIPLEEFVAMQDQWPADMDAPIVTYCGSGHRSTIAMSILWSYGYSDVRSMAGGFNAWVDGGFPSIGVPEDAAEGEEGEEMGMAELDPAFQTFLDDMEAYNTIGIEEVNTMLAEDPESVFLLDVRQPSELEENGWIEGAVNIPLREVAASVEYLPAFDQTIVSYCGSGWRCTIALAALEAMGWEDVLGLKGGSFGGWVEAGYPVAEGEVPEPEALNAAEPDPEIVAEMDEMLANVPEGYGVITADDLFMLQGENPDLILIDVRREEELEENGVIEWENQVHIPLEEFVAMQDQWPEEMDAQIVTYCGSGHRSTIAMTILWSYGYSDVHSLKGGFNAWNEAGYPVVEYTAP